jgi:hypothetical protein
MRLGKKSKTSAERIQYTIDYSQWLATGETISGLPVFAIETNTSPALVVDDISVDGTGKLVTFYVSQGKDGSTYTVTVTATTSAAQTKEDYVTFVVQDPA